MSCEDKLCLVCAAPNNSIHFGVEVCRACAAFFKRAILSGKRFSCRQMSGNCEITKDDKFTCRGCRYDKCRAVGMAYDGSLRRRRNVEDEVSLDSLDRPSTSTNPLLYRIGREYEINVANRREKELELLRTCGTAKLLPHPTCEIYTGTADLVMRTMDITIDEAWIFIHKILPSLSEIPFHEQLDLFRSYVITFSLIDSFMHTWKAWGTFEKFSMCSIALCVDLENPESWLRPGEGGCNRKSLIDSNILYVRDQMSLMVPSLKNARLTDGEAHALFGLMLCETDKHNASERLLAFLESVRAEILLDLQRYYREEMGVNDFSTRLGNLLTICHNVRECSALFQSMFRMQVAMFDTWSAEAQLKQLLL